VKKVSHTKIEVLPAEQRDFKQKMRELNAHRELLDRLLNLVPEGVLVLDDTDRIVYLNQNARILLRYDDWKGDGSPDLSRCFLYEVFESTKSLDFLTYHREIELLDPNLQYLSVSCVPFQRHEQSACRIYFIKDVTREKLSGKQDGISPNFTDNLTFGAGIAHELGNPIAGLSLHAQLLDRLLKKHAPSESDRNQIRNSVNILNNELSRLDETLHQFLDAVRPTNPQFSLTRISEILTSVIETLSEKARKSGISLVIHPVEADEPFLVDGTRIKQALTNVILNAIEVSGENQSVEITLLQKNDWCEIRITDFGKGIPASEIGKIFDPYYSTKESGNGLGLLITYRIIKDHNGMISVKSRPGKGTTFTIAIPLRHKAVQMLPPCKS